MQLQLALAFLLVSVSALAKSDKDMQELFKKYEQIMVEKKTEQVDDVFTAKYLQDSGGKAEFISELKDFSAPKKHRDLTWKKGAMSDLWYAKFGGGDSQFIIKQENGKLKIDGTIGDE